MDNMPNKQSTNVEDSTLVIKLDVSPRKVPIQKRQGDSSLALKPSAKRRKLNNKTYYESPLKHLGKSIDKTISAVSLDESVIVIEEYMDVTASKSSACPQSSSKQLTCPDDSIIILSDNEGVSEETTHVKNKNHRIIQDKDSSMINTEVSEVASVEKRMTRKRNKRAAARNAKFGAKTTVRKADCQDKGNLMPKMLSISIDSEDENIIPNDDTTKPQAKIATVNNSESLSISKNVPPTNSQGDIKESTKKTKTSPLRTESSSQSAASPDDILIVWTQTEGCHTAAEQLASLCVTEEPSNLEERSGYCIDTQGDPSSFRNLNEKHNKNKERKREKTKQRQNPNWARFTEYQSSTNLPPKEPNIGLNQPEINAVGRCYTKEIVVKRPGSLRDIVIDGCNIAMAYTNHKYFSETGLKLVIDYFKLRGHTVKAFIPQHKRSMKHQLLEQLYSEGIVVFTPSRHIGGKRISSHDDRYILEYATMCDGIVVSLDQYRDLYAEKPEWKNTIENRLLVPTFVGKCVMFPEDPLGRSGPKLEEFLRH
ncbi:NEDD4-binding protein 1-like [Diprion similis]|uniref:NEDD4-binding protein 1-like n=1 Tax=Diprion similis TaxID=362088 RepID=UPI001EF79761|nr:NEDD4-binding protein 1-like [Diprion similis]XP_046744991.1 NEDD4-binding protein 1-like [Diprion similis]XP_046744992.1 NEDD4-binding protein 1-like [Diprion similis]